jgi:hypothetical protein
MLHDVKVAKPLEEVNDLGRRFASAPAAEKGDLLLEICQCFHPYLMKYLVMICRGHIPIVGVGKHPAYINKDVQPFLMYFLEKGEPPNSKNLAKAARTLHLAFMHQQGVPMETEEIYDVLMECLVNTINGYDPDYKDKVKLVAGVITDELPKRRLFTAADVNRYVGLDSSRYLRLLCRVGFLEKVPHHRVEATHSASKRTTRRSSVRRRRLERGVIVGHGLGQRKELL